MRHKRTYFFLIFFIFLIFQGTSALADQFPAVVEAEQRAVLAAERAGILSRLHVDVGGAVKKGDLLGEIYHKDLVLRKEQREATAKYLNVLVENLEKLNAKGLTTREELAKARVDQAVNIKEISLAETDIARSRITAPFSGLITIRHVQPHEWVTPGQPVLELYDPSKLRIVTDIPADIAVKLKKGQAKDIWFPDLNEQISAELAIFSPQVDVRSNTVKVYWTVNAAGSRQIGLKPGMKGALRFGTE